MGRSRRRRGWSWSELHCGGDVVNGALAAWLQARAALGQLGRGVQRVRLEDRIAARRWVAGRAVMHPSAVRNVLRVFAERVAGVDDLVAELAEPAAPRLHDLLPLRGRGPCAASRVQKYEVRHSCRLLVRVMSFGLIRHDERGDRISTGARSLIKSTSTGL